MQQSVSLSVAVRAFVDYKVRRYGSTRSTEVTYSSNLGEFVRWCNDIDIRALSLDLIDRYIDWVAQKDYKPKTFKNKVVIVRSFVKYLYAKNLTDIRAESIELPRVQETEGNFLDDNEQQSLIESAECCRDKAIILVMIRSGLRVSEVVNLRTDDLFERSIVVRCGKGKKPRVTFISQDAEQAVNEYLKSKAYTTYLFTNYLGEQLSRQYVHRIIKNCAARCNSHKVISPHTLRHTFATNMLRAGARIEDVQPMMGHANISTTRLYMHFTNDYLHQRYDEIMAKKIA